MSIAINRLTPTPSRPPASFAPRPATPAAPRRLILDPDHAADLRRATRREHADAILARAHALPDHERAILHAVYADARSIADLAALRRESTRRLRRTIRAVILRVLSDEFAFVADHREDWPTTRRRIAEACFLEGRSLRTIARDMGLTLYAVRKHQDAIRAQAAAATSLARARSRA